MERITQSAHNEQEALAGFEYIREDKEFLRLYWDAMAAMMRTERWHDTNEKPFQNGEEFANRTESVLEHCGGMGMLAVAVFEKAKAEGDETITSLDYFDISKKIHIHDIEEGLTGDIKEKTEADQAFEVEARENLKERVRDSNVGSAFAQASDEYAEKMAPEDKFVKAIDELQGMAYLIVTRTFAKSKFADPDDSPARQYVNEFPTLKRLFDISANVIRRQKLISEEAVEMSVMKRVEE